MLGGAHWCPAALILFLDLLVGVLEAASALGGPHLGSKMRMRGSPLGRLWRQSPLMGEGVASWPLSQENLENHLLHFTAPPPTSGNSANHPAQIVPAHFFSSAHFTSLRPPASQVCSLSSSPQPLAAFPQVFSKRYLISVKAGLPSMQYALTLFVLVGKAEGSSRDSG